MTLTRPFGRLLTMRPNGYQSRDRWGEATVSPFTSKTHSQITNIRRGNIKYKIRNIKYKILRQKQDNKDGGREQLQV